MSSLDVKIQLTEAEEKLFELLLASVEYKGAKTIIRYVPCIYFPSWFILIIIIVLILIESLVAGCVIKYYANRVVILMLHLMISLVLNLQQTLTNT